MLTRPAQSTVSVLSKARGFALAAALVLMACVGRPHPITQTERPAIAGRNASPMDVQDRPTVLQFDNQATVYVDVYLVGGPQIQWRLGRVSAGMRETMNVPEPAIDWTTGFVQLVVIPGSHFSAEAARDPHAVLAIAQPVSEVLSQRWTFRQPAGAALQLQATRLVGRQ